MKDNTRLWALIILLAIILIGAFSCTTTQEEAERNFNSHIIQVSYQQCEYLIYHSNKGTFSITHKGNCKNHKPLNSK